MLKRVVECLPQTVAICEGYNTKYHLETLECGHQVISYWPDFGAKRRNCKACVKQAKAEKAYIPVMQRSASVPKKPSYPSKDLVPKKPAQPVRESFMQEKTQDWRLIAARIAVETDSVKLLELAHQLTHALDEQVFPSRKAANHGSSVSKS